MAYSLQGNYTGQLDSATNWLIERLRDNMSIALRQVY